MAMIHPVILSGGAGTRLWPLSQPDHPKQFSPIVSDRTMIQETALRTAVADGFAPPIIVASARHEAKILEQMAAIDVAPSVLMLEPQGRNTAVAIALAAHWIAAKHGDGLMLVMPSDHRIAAPDRLLAAARSASGLAAQGHLVTFGLVPNRPETGFGYIEKGAALDAAAGVFGVTRFIEKPSIETAREYLAQGDFYWNSGIFLFSALDLLKAMEEHCADVADAAAAAMRDGATQGVSLRPGEAAFLSSPNISIDHAVMEKTGRAAVVPIEMGWSDVGSWNAIWELGAADPQGNAVRGEGAVIDGQGNLIYVDGGPPVAAIGIQDCVIVSTAQGVLVVPRERCQDVRAAARYFQGD